MSMSCMVFWFGLVLRNIQFKFAGILKMVGNSGGGSPGEFWVLTSRSTEVM